MRRTHPAVRALALAAVGALVPLTAGPSAGAAPEQPAPLVPLMAPAYATAPCDRDRSTPAERALAERLNDVLRDDLRGYMTAYRVSCALQVIRAVRDRELGFHAAVIAITTVIVETHLQNVSEEVDHDSLGLFQQRASWGTREQRLNPTWATNAFLDRMLELYPRRSWRTAPIGAVCQRVQVSAYPERYQPQAGDAWLIAYHLWNE